MTFLILDGIVLFFFNNCNRLPCDLPLLPVRREKVDFRPGNSTTQILKLCCFDQIDARRLERDGAYRGEHAIATSVHLYAMRALFDSVGIYSAFPSAGRSFLASMLRL